MTTTERPRGLVKTRDDEMLFVGSLYAVVKELGHA